MESNLKRVIGDLNKSRGLGENGTANVGSNSSGGSSGSADASNPIAKVCCLKTVLFCAIMHLCVRHNLVHCCIFSHSSLFCVFDFGLFFSFSVHTDFICTTTIIFIRTDSGSVE